MGFFTKSQLQKRSEVKVDINDLESDCLSCGLFKASIHPKMEVSGQGRKGILIIGEFSSDEDDEMNQHFYGDRGEPLKQQLRFNNVNINRDCWKVNAIRCSPNGHNLPSPGQVQNCFPYIKKTIKQLKPKLILLMGDLAVSSLFGKDYSNRSIHRWRKYVIPDQEYGCNIIPLYHPYHIFRQKKKKRDKNLESVFNRDLAFALRQLERPVLKQKNYEDNVTVLTDFIRVKKLLNRILKRKSKIYFDYESTGLKPFRKGHKIVSIGLAVSPTKAFAFPYQWKNFWTEKELKVIKKLWTKILRDDEILKSAHNAKFEQVWSTVFFNVLPKIHFDTMMCEHVLDNRSASTGLKFQTFVRFGVRPYDKEIAPFLKSKNGEFNTVEKAPFKELMIYNGLDCIYGWMMYEQQLPQITKRRQLDDALKSVMGNIKTPKKSLLSAYNFFMEGNEQMAKIQLNGVNMDSHYYQKAEKDLEKKVNELKSELENGREAKAFYKMFGRPIKITSNQDLGKLFYEVLNKEAVYTAKGGYKTDKMTLEGLNLPYVKKLLQMKKYEKAKGTYLGQFAREIFRTKMYPFWDLNIPVSYRSSSSKPNFQNIPKRDAEIKAIIRKGIVPKRGCILSEIDFSGAEVITSATYHKDPTFINYLIDPHTDMHRDNATDLLMLPPDMLENPDYTLEQKKKVKKIRFFAKNNWTFAQFYGDWFGSCAPMFWENVIEADLELPNGMTCREWLEDKGIYELGEVEKDGPTEGSFMEHCAHVEDKMWNERFPVYTKWKEDIVDTYRDHGFIPNHFGFRFTGYMSNNQCTNFPIQSASFHMLVYTLIEVQKFIDKNNLKTKIIGQIHDSIISNVPKDEIKFYHAGVNKIVKRLKDEFEWLIIPMEIEAEISKLREDGGNFSDLREVDPDNASLDIWKEAA
ncbi:MAG: hypothetical protein GY797_38405 [Deltaproteobacteria bacterium]|nr:hypothetical protein [Deltaproteobacteria bacterium]